MTSQEFTCHFCDVFCVTLCAYPFFDTVQAISKIFTAPEEKEKGGGREHP